jgi:hypothetical protein
MIAALGISLLLSASASSWAMAPDANVDPDVIVDPPEAFEPDINEGGGDLAVTGGRPAPAGETPGTAVPAQAARVADDVMSAYQAQGSLPFTGVKPGQIAGILIASLLTLFGGIAVWVVAPRASARRHRQMAR